ncbi:hypothetical protein AC249_AIPGENE23130, partial [Exaiptasia diaphana]
MGRTSKPLPGRPMPIHSIPETSNRSSTSRHTENGANFQNRQTPNVLIPSVPGGCEDVLRDHRDRLLQETLTENENVDPESENEISHLETIEKQFQQLQEQNRQILAALQENQHKDKNKTKVTVSKAIA